MLRSLVTYKYVHKWCRVCGRETRHRALRMRAAVVVILSIITFGGFLVLWLPFVRSTCVRCHHGSLALLRGVTKGTRSREREYSCEGDRDSRSRCQRCGSLIDGGQGHETIVNFVTYERTDASGEPSQVVPVRTLLCANCKTHYTTVYRPWIALVVLLLMAVLATVIARALLR